MSIQTLKAGRPPAHVPPGAERSTLGALADRAIDLGTGRRRVRASFRHGRLHAAGPLLSIERSECGTAGRVHLARGWRGRHYIFDATELDSTVCWIWTVEDEHRAAATATNTRSMYQAPIVAP
jgi:hypothetical protein